MGGLDPNAKARSPRAWDGLTAALAWAAVATAARVAWLIHQPAVPVWDGAIYHRTAVRIARGMGFVDTWNNLPPFKPTAFYPVGYPATLGAGYALFGPHPWVAGLINVLSAAVCTFLLVRLARSAFGPRSGHVAGALYALAPGPIFYTSAFMTEPLSAAVLCAAVALLASHARTARAWPAIAAGLLLGFGGLVRPPALLVAPVLALCAVPTRSLVAVVRTLVLVGVASCVVVLPWTARNCARLDGCALVSVNGGSNLFIGADAQAHGGYRDLHPGEGCDRVHGEVAKDRCYGHLAMQKIRAHPLAWLALAPEKVERLLGDEATPVSYLRSATDGRAFAGRDWWYGALRSYHLAVLALALLALVGLGARDRARTPREVVLMVGAIATLVVVHVVFFGADRYHLVFTPLLCALAGGALRRHPSPR